MAKKKIEVQGLSVQINTDNYISLTDIAKSESGRKPANLIAKWLQNQKTLLFLETWEKVHNPNFKVAHMGDFRLKAVSERFSISPKKYIEQTNAIGIRSNAGKYGGTYAHIEIAIAFAYWLDPVFQVYFLKEFNRLKTQNELTQYTDWTLQKILTNTNENYILTESLQKLIEEEKKKLGSEDKQLGLVMNFKGCYLATFREAALDNSSLLTPKNYVEMTNSIGIIAKSGRYGGTYAHKDIALNFCYWLSPEFQVAMIRAFQILMERGFITRMANFQNHR